MSKMSTATATKLVNQTFVEGLHIQQGLVKKEFAELNKVDSGRQNRKKLQRKRVKDEHLVFNYLWRYFPEAMVTKNQSPILFHQEIGDLEFEKILKTARRYYGYRLVNGSVMVAGSIILLTFSVVFNLMLLGIISILSLSVFLSILICSLHSYLEPDSPIESPIAGDKYKKLRELYENIQKQKEFPRAE